MQECVLGHETNDAPGAAERNASMNYTITITLTTHQESDEHLKNEQAIEDEIRSWLEDLSATVHAVTVTKEGKAS
jgi:hypothetical protein